jgi:hypothetical protein
MPILKFERPTRSASTHKSRSLNDRIALDRSRLSFESQRTREQSGLIRKTIFESPNETRDQTRLQTEIISSPALISYQLDSGFVSAPEHPLQ